MHDRGGALPQERDVHGLNTGTAWMTGRQAQRIGMEPPHRVTASPSLRHNHPRRSYDDVSYRRRKPSLDTPGEYPLARLRQRKKNRMAHYVDSPTGAAATRRTASTSNAGCENSPEMMPVHKRDEALARLARAGGQVQGIARMVEQGRHCTEVLQQIAAVQKALDAVGTIVLRNYLERCVTSAIEDHDPLIYDELMRVISRYRR